MLVIIIVTMQALGSTVAGKMKPKQVYRHAVGLFILAFFLWFTRGAMSAYFDGDDMMNLYGYWTSSIWELVKGNLLVATGYYRPMGGVFYRLAFALFGFHALPFRLMCFAFLIANLYLLYQFVKRLAGSAEMAALATLLACYHARAGSLYYSSGKVYHVLCFFFYFSAFVYYLRLRQSHRQLNNRQLFVLCCLYICALNSEEMAVSLPACLLTYELLFHLRRRTEWTLRALAPIALTGLLTLGSIAGKLSSSSPFASTPDFMPVISLSRYLENFGMYTSALFYQDRSFTTASTVLLLALMLALAWAMKSAQLKFAWWFIVITILPVAFISAREGVTEIYIPMVGWAIYVATLLVRARQLLTVKLHLEPVVQAALFLIVAIALTTAHLWARRHFDYGGGGGNQVIKTIASHLSQSHPTVPPNSGMLFIDDPFGGDFTVGFALALYYRDNSLRVFHWKSANAALDQLEPSKYDSSKYHYCFQWRGGRLIEFACRPPWPRPKLGPFMDTSDPNADIYFVRDIGGEIGEARWTFRRPEMRFTLASARRQKFIADLAVNAATMQQTGPVTLSFLVNGRLLGRLECPKPGEYRFEKPVDPTWLRTAELNLVAIEADKLYVAQADHAQLGFLLIRAGFVEDNPGSESTL